MSSVSVDVGVGGWLGGLHAGSGVPRPGTLGFGWILVAVSAEFSRYSANSPQSFEDFGESQSIFANETEVVKIVLVEGSSESDTRWSSRDSG
jgi:hypothetical protein